MPQNKKFLYTVVSKIKYAKRGLRTEIAYYGSNTRVSEQSIIEKAKQNILNKFEESSGRLIEIKVVRVKVK